ncbi:MAG: hypothetical protein UR32_C0022G0005 [candidate division WS6 bacterium GW2011_GWE2_33_157]|uniref:Uncharacterized protein n=1 Tax=candidate division WS6 bacterium GW2011_GWB1_33_6 TaxID=1619088 RepID=A0A0G0ATI7_9BACT|nr:MAG: hypothetical protein UR32_C0022G0005 [candidate division WS6 bacterium GW2011_GWE2_33_157]KKP54731.1 MAG: hypothetical protein UR47_C0012G0016 [candidate division WS6 bacterium GW2011_GWB1_33_6]KKP54923.1 MAG: hypothetical protein UR45_C0007G0005 [candidate division WS6 bacterium GW2011_WS6_33_547]KKP56754.1 MAG: hypothetical protein UR49_C0009G0015 [candidate division WS6 bacterium GW2011_GWF2_33_92]KKP82119.1 MAG: hypothetical protein UR84_C0008G0016 [candidate division WS6 bacterium 
MSKKTKLFQKIFSIFIAVLMLGSLAIPIVLAILDVK